MKLSEIINFDGSIWAYAQMAKYAREMHGPENFKKHCTRVDKQAWSCR